MRKLLMAMVAVALAAGVGAGTAQACSFHGLEDAATLEKLYGDTAKAAGVSFTFDTDSYSVVGPDGTSMVFHFEGELDWLSPNLNTINDYIQGFITDKTVDVQKTTATDVEAHESTEKLAEYDG